MKYKTTTDICDWYGGDCGYGINPVLNKEVKEFDSDREALSWAYNHVQKSDLTPYKSPRKLYGVHIESQELKDDDDDPVHYHVQYIHRYGGWYVFTKFKGDTFVRGYRLHKDGTLGRWNGIY